MHALYMSLASAQQEYFLNRSWIFFFNFIYMYMFILAFIKKKSKKTLTYYMNIYIYLVNAFFFLVISTQCLYNILFHSKKNNLVIPQVNKHEFLLYFENETQTIAAYLSQSI